MEMPTPPNIVRKYHYLDVKTGRWKMTRNHMSAEAAATFFDPARSPLFQGRAWGGPAECMREDRGHGADGEEGP